MEQEERFYALLNGRPQVQVDGGTLVLTGPAMTMTFRRSSWTVSNVVSRSACSGHARRRVAVTRQTTRPRL